MKKGGIVIILLGSLLVLPLVSAQEQVQTYSGFYLIVNGGITNLGKITCDNTNFFGVKFISELKDDKDNIYTLVGTNTQVRSFQPNLEKKFNDIFEIPKQASGLKFFIKDNTKIIKVVNLE